MSGTSDPKAFLTLDDAAKRTERSSCTLRRAVKNRELASWRPGGPRGKIYIRVEDLENYINRFRTAALGERALAAAN